MTKIAFITFGCTLNVADSELMMGLLSSEGFEIVQSSDEADLVVINSCTVKNMAENKFFKTIRDMQSKNKLVIAAGCVPQAEKSYLANQLKDVSVIGTKQLNRIVDVVRETIDGNVMQLVVDGENKRHSMPRIRRNNIIGIVPISEGCLGNCTYCKSKMARGDLVSYDSKVILEEIKSAVKEGCKEIWLTSQDCGAYGLDIDTDITKLLESVLKLKGDFKVRLGMSNPNHILPIVDELILLYKENKEKLFRFIHIPVQAGSDRILKLMNRFYTKADFIDLCRRLRGAMPDITIATDVICGFPGETEEEFEETLELMKTIQPDVINRARFWARPGTVAATMDDQLAGTVTNERSRKLNALLQEISKQRNEFWKDWEGKILIDEEGHPDSNKNPTWLGRNYAYKPFVIKQKTEVGKFINVKVSNIEVFHLEAGLVVNSDA